LAAQQNQIPYISTLLCGVNFSEGGKKKKGNTAKFCKTLKEFGQVFFLWFFSCFALIWTSGVEKRKQIQF